METEKHGKTQNEAAPQPPDTSKLPDAVGEAFRAGWNLIQEQHTPDSPAEQAHVLGKFARQNGLTGAVTKGAEFGWKVGDQEYRVEQCRVISAKGKRVTAEQPTPTAAATETPPQTQPTVGIAEPPAAEGLRRTGAPAMATGETQDSKPETRPSVWWPSSTLSRVAFIILLIAAFFTGVLGEMSRRKPFENLASGVRARWSVRRDCPITEAPILTVIHFVAPVDVAVGLAAVGCCWGVFGFARKFLRREVGLYKYITTFRLK